MIQLAGLEFKFLPIWLANFQLVVTPSDSLALMNPIGLQIEVFNDLNAFLLNYKLLWHEVLHTITEYPEKFVKKQPP